jgi:hypothetical protein
MTSMATRMNNGCFLRKIVCRQMPKEDPAGAYRRRFNSLVLFFANVVRIPFVQTRSLPSSSILMHLKRYLDSRESGADLLASKQRMK